MASDDDDADDGDQQTPPLTSRIGIGDRRRYRAVVRYRHRDRFHRVGRRHELVDVIGKLLAHHGLTEEVRRHCIALFWAEIAGERIAANTMPISFNGPELVLSARSSSWIQEMQFLKTKLIRRINEWVDANRRWLGPPPLVEHIRVALGARQRASLVDEAQTRRLREYDVRRRTPRVENRPPSEVSATDRASIAEQASTILDPELRAMVESVRIRWNR